MMAVRMSLLVVLPLLLLAGCTAPPAEPAQTIYAHNWFYGTANYPGDRDPVFEDTFDVGGTRGNLSVIVEWRIERGHAAVELTPPTGPPANITPSRPDDRSVASVPGSEGAWAIRIPTWRAEDGAFPTGQIRVEVKG